MPDDAQERTEEATPRKRERARRKGTVVRSTDLVHALVMLALALLLPSIVGAMGQAFALAVKSGVGALPRDASFASISGYWWSLALPCLAALAPLIAVAMAVGLLGNLAQVGFVVSAEALTPSLGKLNPLEGAKRLASRDALFEAAKATVKTAVFAYVAWTAIRANWDQILGLSLTSAHAAVVAVGQLAHSIVLKVAVAWLVVAAVDYLYQRKKIDRMLRMSKEELKQEFRESEQAPELKSAMNQRRRKLSKMRTRDAVKSSDVVVTNPTHYAVALKYDKDKMHAPMVVAKGKDLLALRIRDLAKELDVPIVPNPPLARQLYAACEVGDYIPRELFQAVAEVLAYVYKTLNRFRSRR
ncbi:MAG: flagellar biosynthesis protein FlhB [Armatimonadetes bacterium]|jgi:flagellar biosynthetic protein FlhB|nr:flagellar biosynthesis protein FlhB [Armatimonadota bacterium]